MKRQAGAALLLLVALLAAGAGTFFVASGEGKRKLLARAGMDAARLAHARELLLGHALSNARRPGELAFPDRRADGNYDGNGDCVPTWSDVTPSHLLGRLPAFLEQGCGTERPGPGLVLRDASGERLWYAVSRQLLYPAPVLNSAVAGDWLEVFSVHGVTQAAFVVFAPGPVLGVQQRTAGAGPTAYLDGLQLAGTSHHNGDEDSRFVTAPARSDFNDRLLVVERAEFLDMLTLHVARVLRTALEAHRTAYGDYPHAALAGGACHTGLADGFFPTGLGSCAAVPVSPNWFESDWSQVTHYTRLAPSLARLRFNGCAREFTVTPLGVSPSAGTCI